MMRISNDEREDPLGRFLFFPWRVARPDGEFVGYDSLFSPPGGGGVGPGMRVDERLLLFQWLVVVSVTAGFVMVLSDRRPPRL